MNKTALKNFAVWARRDLIKRISDRATLLGVYENKEAKPVQATTPNDFRVNSITFNYKKEIRDSFIKRVHELGYQDAIEEIAYTWFNRIVALRFMEINGYLTNGKNGEKIYIIGSTIDGKNEPDSLTNANKLSFVDKSTVYSYQDANDSNGLYRYILTKQCNDLNKAMPLMFEKIEDYAELLLPDHLLDKGAIIDRLTHDIDENDFNITLKNKNGENTSQVEIVGWLYQFYISEKKEDVFAGLKNNTKITKGTLPAATQIFTPNWIVRYMTDNSLGKMWIDGHKNSKLKQDLKYFIEGAEQTDEVKAKLDEINKQYAEKKVTDITFIDPCCGSGHILVYAFDLFYKMYLESGYVDSDIPAKILQNNLIGIDVDKRAVQLTSFALTMKALSYDKDFLTKHIYPNVIDIKESNSLNQNEIKNFFKIIKLSQEDEEVVLEVIEKFKDAELFGSLIKDFKHTPEQYDIALKYFQSIEPNSKFDLIEQQIIKNVKPLLLDLLKGAYTLSSKYDIVVTNPPYAGNSKLPNVVGKYLQSNFPNTKSDLFSAFIERNMDYSTTNGNVGIMCPYVWMFIQSYEALRKKIIEQKTLTSLVQLEYGGFAEAVVPICAFTFRNCKTDEKGEYIRLEQFKGPDLQGLKTLEAVQNRNCGYRYSVSSNNFSKIPGSPIAYWVLNHIYQIFENGVMLKDLSTPKCGLKTGITEKYIKSWFEVNLIEIGFNINNRNTALDSKLKWFPVVNGGKFRKWNGNFNDIVYWFNDGKEIRELKCDNGRQKARPQNMKYYFKQCLTWSAITSNKLSVRIAPQGTVISGAGYGLFNIDEKYMYLLSLLNSNTMEYMAKIFSQTLNFEVGVLENLPILYNKNYNVKIDITTKSCIDLSKLDWDQYETSWDFKKSPLI